jgi:anti-sigma28 factor (negative regulator of flagellin synthesis)
MQVNQNPAVNSYTQGINAYNPSSVSAVTAQAADTKKAEAAGSEAKKPDMDRVEISAEAKVTTKMTDAERADLVKSLKDDLDSQMSRFTNMMMRTFQKQGITAAKGDDFWKQIASGNFTVDAQTKADAEAAISEDGYWGVKQTSARIFDFAKALAGDDPDKMKKMQDAVEKGFKQAEDAWGGSLPGICGDTKSAINKLFDDYYKENEA